MADLGNVIHAGTEQLCEKEEEDWALILVVCEQASSDVILADEAINTLIRIFSQGGPRHIRLTAARLWAVMLHNCSNEFFERSCSPTFLSVIKQVIDQRAPGHPLRDRLVSTLGDAVFSNCQTQPFHPLAQLWRQVKPNGYPDEVCSCGVRNDSTRSFLIIQRAPRHASDRLLKKGFPHQMKPLQSLRNRARFSLKTCV
jgi:hypothetical protein